MPTSETQQLTTFSFDKLGIIAGNGILPRKLSENCRSKSIEPFIVALEGQTRGDTVEGFEHVWCNIGSAGKIIKTLKAHNIKDLVLIGGVRRPSFSELKPDMKGAEIITRIGMKALGDNDILELLKDELSREGFNVHGVQDFIQDLLTPHGVLGKIKPNAKMKSSIKRGVEVSQAIGGMDIGQAIIVQQGIIIGVEGIEGTDELISRCKAYLRKGEGGILVKTCKPQQDKTLDLPTIGPDTISRAAECGLVGIVAEAGKSILTDADLMSEMVDRNKMFFIGVDIGDYI